MNYCLFNKKAQINKNTLWQQRQENKPLTPARDPTETSTKITFLTLPGEIRNKIYYLCLSCEWNIKVPILWRKREKLKKPVRLFEASLHPLLNTCRQIRHEGLGIFVQVNTFEVYWGTAVDYLQTWLTAHYPYDRLSMFEGGLNNIQSLAFPQFSSGEWWDRKMKLIQSCSNLEAVEISFTDAQLAGHVTEKSYRWPRTVKNLIPDCQLPKLLDLPKLKQLTIEQAQYETGPDEVFQLGMENLWTLKLWFEENFKERGLAVEVHACVRPLPAKEEVEDIAHHQPRGLGRKFILAKPSKPLHMESFSYISGGVMGQYSFQPPHPQPVVRGRRYSE